MEMLAPQVASAWLSPCVHPVYARLVCAELRRRGWSEHDILEGTRLKWDGLHGSNQFLSFDQIRRLVARAIALTQCPWLGLAVGMTTQLSAHGAVGYAGMSASTLGQLMALIQRFAGLRQRLGRFEVDTDTRWRIRFVALHSSLDVQEYVSGHIAAGLAQLMTTVTGLSLTTAISIHWPFPEPPWAQHYRDFCQNSQFGAEHLCLDLPMELLDTPSLAPDPQAFRSALRECERQLQQLQLGTVTERIQRRLQEVEGEYPSLERMAALEHVSVRTLNRLLAQEGIRYQQLLDTVREEWACWMLIHSTASVDVIAEKLGYQDPSNFSRTFRRWLGVTPSAFRQQRHGP